MSFLGKIFGDGNTKAIKEFQLTVEKINSLEPAFSTMTDAELRAKTVEFKNRLAKGETLDDLLPEAFAAVRESSKRTLKQRHFDVQLMGGIALHQGKIAEMKTGEGKTLVATLPVYLNALLGKGVHVVTVNDYLSRRDAVWMGQIYHALGVTTGIINHESSFIYDPTIVTDSSSVIRPDEIPFGRVTAPDRGRGQAQAGIQGEKDLDPPARTGPEVRFGTGGRLREDDKNGEDKKEKELDKTRDELGSFKVVHEFLRGVTRREAYAADITYGTNNEFGFDYLRDNLEYEEKVLRQRDYHYAIVDEIDSILIDEARTPLIISAPTSESEDLYKTFAGVARSLVKDRDYTVDEKLKAISLTEEGIGRVEKILNVENLYTEGGVKYVHHLETAVRAEALYHLDKEYVVKNDEVVIVDEFTGRIMPGRRWSEGLHQAIEAKEGVSVQKESRTFASITFQNYFRLYRKLSGMTGTALTSKEEFFKVYRLDVVAMPTNKPVGRRDLNDVIFKTEHGKFTAISRQIKELNKIGQPVLVGTVSIENNEKLSGYLKRDGVPHEILNAKNHEREGEIIAQAGRKGAVTIATNMAGRGVDIKLGGNPATVESYEEVKRLGGLFVLGTERHEARRIDNQLRGRAGRQGDPGTTQFFVSLEDSLMRIFAVDTIKKVMNFLKVAEDEPIENKMISKSLETAQTKIEGFNFDSRKHVLDYDDVLNHQRKIVYDRRRKILIGGSAAVDEYLESLATDNPDFLSTVKSRKTQMGDEVFYATVERAILQTIDMFWVEHLELMDYSRSSVNLRAYGQRDPLVEYKREGLRLFKEMEAAVRGQVIRILENLSIAPAASAGRKIDLGRLKEIEHQAKAAQGVAGAAPAAGAASSSSGAKEPGRNDPCFCGAVNPATGKVYKYKQCGLINASYHRK